MERRALLKLMMAGMLAVATAALAVPFTAALAPTPGSMLESVELIELPELQPGVVHEVRVGRVPLLILRPTQAQQDAIKRLDPYVSDPTIRTYQKELGAYVYWGISSRRLCGLSHQAPNSRDNEGKAHQA